MPKFNIVVFGGDYAGPEVTVEAVKVSSVEYQSLSMVVEPWVMFPLWASRNSGSFNVHPPDQMRLLRTSTDGSGGSIEKQLFALLDPAADCISL